MSARPTSPRRKTLRAAPWWILATSFAALAALAIFLAPTPQSHAAEAARATAGYQTTEKISLALDVPASPAKRSLTVELLDKAGDVLGKVSRDLPAGPAVQTQILFSGIKKPAKELTVRSKLDGKTTTVGLDTILLVRAHETSLASSTELHSGSEAELRCAVRGVRSLIETVPLAADVTVKLIDSEKKARTLYTGKTKADDAATSLRFAVPELPAGSYKLEVVTKSTLGEEMLQRDVKVTSSAKVLLTSDKPLYQPGQTMHIRALALRDFDLRPVAGQALTFEVEDGKGNKVCKKEVTTSEFGIASIDFTLADEVNMGEYRLRALVANQQSEKTVTVKKYVLPKFKVELKTDKSYYLPKEIVKGTLQVDYFFGKPVAGGKVEIKASTFDVAFKEFHTFKGETDKTGHLAFEFRLPDYFVGLPLTKGNAIIKVDAKITDTADHSESAVRTYPVSDQPIKVSFLPEGGRLIPGLENRIYVAALYPDGSPAACAVDVHLGNNDKIKPVASLKTNASGLAEFKITPKAENFRPGNWQANMVEMLGGTQQQNWGPTNLFDLTATARDARGARATLTSTLSADPLGENVLLRLNKAIYKGGDRLGIEVLSAAGTPTVYVDVIKAGQAVLTRWLDVKDGKASTHLDLPAGLFGALEVHAYQILNSGEVVRDARVIYVNPANELKIDVKPDNDVYLPGNVGKVRFQVTDAKGKPTAAALGVIIVDEAVYAMQEIQPGLEKVFFTLQEQLLKPMAQVNFKPGEGIDVMVQRPGELPPVKQQAAQALLANVRPKAPAVWQVEPAVTRKQQIAGRIQQIAAGLFNHATTQETILVKDEKTGKMVFPTNIIEKAIKAGHLAAAQAGDPFSGLLSLEQIQKLETNFTADRLAAGMTQSRMTQLFWAVINKSSQHTREWQSRGRWVFPGDVLTQASTMPGYGDRVRVDGWGRAFKLMPRPAGDKNPTGYAQFNDVYIVSAGPDGKFGTADDLTMTFVDHWHMAHYWFGPTRQTAQRHAWGGMDPRWRFRAGRELEQLARRDMKAGEGGRGGFPPMAPGLPMAGAMPGGAPVAKMLGAETKMKADKPTSGGGGGGGPSPEPPAMRLREYFPETLLWQPSLITDDKGQAILEVPFADSITTWRLSASASAKNGQLGGTASSLRVFQDFFVDLDLPVALTQNDEVAFPVAVYNYLKTPQTVKLSLKQEPWFQLVDSDGLERTLKLEAGQVTAIKFRIKAAKVGHMPLTVEAKGSKMSDAIKRIIEIMPDGKPVEQVYNDRLEGNAKHTISLPPSAIDDASKLYVKIYPGVLSQVVEGLDGMLRMPGGCFEQTSSSAYPNVLIVDYIKKAKLASPAILAKAEQYLNGGYQRLLTFERPGGGFDWWGSGEPLVWLSAYGLQEFNDMAKVWPVDRGIIERTQKWLLKQQAADGTWSKIGATHGESIERMGDAKLLLTAYVSWSILDSTNKDAAWKKTDAYRQLKTAIEYIRLNAPKAENAYILALCANALASWDATDDSTFEICKKVLKKLDDLKERKADWNAICFPAGGQSLAYARGDSMTVETTALATLAMVKSGQFTTSVNQALTYLVKQKQAGGHWGSTQATILALKALLAGMGGTEIKGTIPFAIKADGKEVAKGEITAKNSDVMQQFDLTKYLKKGGSTEVTIEVKEKTSLMYQVMARHFEPHKKDDAQAVKKPMIEVAVDYDRTKLSTADLLKATATLKYHGKVPTFNVILDLPIPPGFTVDAGDFAEMVAAKKVAKFSVTARQVILYLGDVKEGTDYRFEYSLKPKYPIKAKTAPAVAYEYYTPTNRATAKPVDLVVEQAKK